MTDGDGPTPASYTVLLDGAVSGTTGPDDVYTMTSIPRGTHVVGLKEEPDRCRFLTNPRELTVEVNRTTAVTFLVLCEVAGPEDPQTR